MSSVYSLQYALHVYNEVMSVGQKYGIRNAGYYALRSLRIEKFFAFWGQDLDTFTTPLECGREFRVKFDKVGPAAGEMCSHRKPTAYLLEREASFQSVCHLLRSKCSDCSCSRYRRHFKSMSLLLSSEPEPLVSRSCCGSAVLLKGAAR